MRIETRGGEEKPIFFGGLFFITIAKKLLKPIVDRTKGTQQTRGGKNERGGKEKPG
jgi:hypothetical protein